MIVKNFCRGLKTASMEPAGRDSVHAQGTTFKEMLMAVQKLGESSAKLHPCGRRIGHQRSQTPSWRLFTTSFTRAADATRKMG